MEFWQNWFRKSNSSLITRNYDLSKGDILFNKKPIHEYELSQEENLDMYLKTDTYFLVQLKKISLTALVKLTERN